MKQPSAAKQLAAFLAKFSPDVAAEARKAIAHLRRRLRGAWVLIYDNYKRVGGRLQSDPAGGAYR